MRKKWKKSRQKISCSSESTLNSNPTYEQMFPNYFHDGVPARHHLQPSSPYATKYTEAGLKKQQRIPIARDGSNPSNKNNKWRDLQALHNWAKKVKHSNWNSFGWTSFSGSLLSSMLGVNLRKLKCNVDLNKSGTIWPLYAHYRVTSGFTNSFRFRTNTTLDHPVHEAIWMHEPTSRDWLERLGLSATAGADPGRGVLSRGPGNQNCIKKTVVTLYRDE